MTTDDIRTQLDDERRIIEGVTPGPWQEYAPGDLIHTFWGIDGEPDAEPVASDMAFVDLTFITHARTALPVRNAQVEAVLALHQPHWDDLPWRRRQPDIPGCTECYDEGRPFQYPCPTVRAIDGAGK